jgi:hypothetical protein
VRRLWRNHRQCPSVLSKLRRQTLIPSLLSTALAALLLLPAFFFGGVAPVSAAEVLQVSGPDRLLIGDRNRTSMVRLGCMAVTPGSEAAAQAWLRLRLPRRTRVNLRPLTESEEGVLVARVSSLQRDTGDLTDGLVAAGLASPLPCG